MRWNRSRRRSHLGADENPGGMIRMEPADSGRLSYSVGIGPWPDAYAPQFVWRMLRRAQDSARLLLRAAHMVAAPGSSHGRSLTATR